MKPAVSLFACLVLLSCNSGSGPASDQSGNTTAVQSNNVITFRADGQPVSTTGLTISRFRLLPGKAPYLNFTSDMHGEKRTININVSGTVPGTYALSKDLAGGSSHGIYFPDYGVASDSYLFEAGSVVLTEVDTVKNIVSGTFSGTAKNEAGRIISITDGRIVNGTLTPGITSMQ